jgi:hypothetical protein
MLFRRDGARPVSEEAAKCPVISITAEVSGSGIELLRRAAQPGVEATMKADRVVGMAVLLLIAIFIACGSSTPAPTSTQPSPAAKKEPALYTGKSCLSQMASVAARWQPDALPIHMESHLNAESNGQEGKSTIWRAMFASASRGTSRTFTCSGSRLKEEPSIGVSASTEMASAPGIASSMFQPYSLTVDSDRAFAIAKEHGGDALLKKDPQQPAIYTLDWDSKNKELVWGVVFGTSSADSKGFAVIDASTGKFLRAGK